MSICHNKKYEREFVNMMTEKGIECYRIAGSGIGKEAVSDCIILHKTGTYLVEVKATKEPVFYMRKAVREQLSLLHDTAIRNNAVPLLAIKFKHKGWNFIVVKDGMESLPFQKDNLFSSIF